MGKNGNPVAGRNQVRVLVREADGTETLIDAAGTGSMGKYLVRAMNRVAAAYQPEIQAEVDSVSNFVKTLGDQLAGAFRAAFKPVPPVKEVAVTFGDFHVHEDGRIDVAILVDGKPAGQQEIRLTDAVNLDLVEKMYREPIVTGECVTVYENGTAQVTVVINGKAHSYIENDVSLPGRKALAKLTEEAVPLGEVSDYAMGFRQNLIDLLNVHGWDAKLGKADHELAAILIQHLEKFQEVHDEIEAGMETAGSLVERNIAAGQKAPTGSEVSEHVGIKPTFSAEEETEAQRARISSVAYETTDLREAELPIVDLPEDEECTHPMVEKSVCVSCGAVLEDGEPDLSPVDAKTGRTEDNLAAERNARKNKR